MKNYFLTIINDEDGAATIIVLPIRSHAARAVKKFCRKYALSGNNITWAVSACAPTII